MKKHPSRYFIKEQYDDVYYHGSIGNADIEEVLLQEGWTPVHFPHHDKASLATRMLRLIYLFRILGTIRSGDTVLFQHPVHAGMHRLLLKLLRKRKQVTIICIVSDINGIKYGNPALLEQEIAELARYRYFIVHNESMRTWLNTRLPGKVSATLEFFDYLTKPINRTRQKEPTIAYAGNLSKSPFVLELSKVVSSGSDLRFYIYGKPAMPGSSQTGSLQYKGSYEANTLPITMEGAFGLVWDGEAIAGSRGSFGAYMTYISHHKVSLYIICGMPLIVYEGAGSAYLVKKYRIGITVRSLYEIEKALAAVTDEEYAQMCRNTRELAMRIASGSCLKNALNQLEIKIEEERNALN